MKASAQAQITRLVASIMQDLLSMYWNTSRYLRLSPGALPAKTMPAHTDREKPGGRPRGAGHIWDRRSTGGRGDPRELVDIQLLTASLGVDTRLLEQLPRAFGGTGP